MLLTLLINQTYCYLVFLFLLHFSYFSKLSVVFMYLFKYNVFVLRTCVFILISKTSYLQKCSRIAGLIRAKISSKIFENIPDCFSLHDESVDDVVERKNGQNVFACDVADAERRPKFQISVLLITFSLLILLLSRSFFLLNFQNSESQTHKMLKIQGGGELKFSVNILRGSMDKISRGVHHFLFSFFLINKSYNLPGGGL